MDLPINIKDLLTARSVEWERLKFKQGWNGRLELSISDKPQSRSQKDRLSAWGLAWAKK